MSVQDDLAAGLVVVMPIVWPDDLLSVADWMFPAFREVRLRRTADGVQASMDGVTWTPDPDYGTHIANEALSRLHPGWKAYAAKMGWN